MLKKLTKWLGPAVVFIPLISLAQPYRQTGYPTLTGGRGIGGGAPIRTIDDVLIIMQKFIIWFQNILLILAVIFILWSAYLFISAGGSDTKVKAARDTLIYAAVGIGVVLLAYAVEFVVRQLLGTP
jgi:hypothetical protein